MSSTSYPSSLSSFRDSALGLYTPHVQIMSTPSTPSPAPLRERRQKSRADLQTPPRSTQSTSPNHKAAVPQTQPVQRTTGPRVEALRQNLLKRTSDSSLASTQLIDERARLRASRTRPDKQPEIQPRARTTRAPPSPTKTVDTMAEDWDAELSRDAARLDLGPIRTKSSMSQLKEEQRKKDDEWERSGLWQAQRDSAREAEERTRRDAGREIAYPPQRPRVPPRAASSGVTSVHIGIRPRLHPSHVATSTQLNQPDMTLPLPHGGPAEGSSADPEDPFVKAQSQYDEWLAKRDEREGGIGDDGYGTRAWIPRERTVARPSPIVNPAVPSTFVNPMPTMAPMPTMVYPTKSNYPGPGSDGSHPGSAKSNDPSPATPDPKYGQEGMYDYFDPYQMYNYWAHQGYSWPEANEHGLYAQGDGSKGSLLYEG